jgi:DNA-binding transcriptional regulator GbsR (MarR family)
VKKLPPVAEQFIEDFGLALEAEGLPRTAGRLIGLILMLDEGGDLETLAHQLRVSRASISTNTRMLESVGAIERYTIPGKRRIVYRSARIPQNRQMEAMGWRMRRTADIVRATRRQLPKEMAGANERLKRVEDYYDSMLAVVDSVLKKIERTARAKRSRSR